jgi:putative spermidine/putrescine transport system permease protein
MQTGTTWTPISRRHLRRVLYWIVVGGPGLLVLGMLILPVICVIPMSFSSSMIYELIPTDPGFDQYRRFFHSPEWMLALMRSLQVAVGTAVVATTLGTLAALGLTKMRSPWRQICEAALISPRIVPTIVFAVAAYYVFSSVGLIGTITALVMAHSVMAFPFVVVLVGSALYSFDRSLEEASKSLGASALRSFFRVTLPHIRLAVVGSALFSFNISFDEVVVTLFISGARTKTLPVKVWDAIVYEVTPILPAICTLVILVTMAMLLPLALYRHRS